VLPSLLHKNQYGFIKNRSIQDCIAWDLEYLHSCHQSKNELLILKLDFEKAFDKVEHEFMIQVMTHKGLLAKWIQWMSSIFNSGTSSVILNGLPGKVFHCKRGVRQGDPLSPLLFVLAADFLQTLLNHAVSSGTLSLPIPITDHEFPILQYADDTLIFIKACPIELAHLKDILSSFAESSDLKVNYSKSMMVPLNVSPATSQSLAQILGCSIGDLPFTYLGLPLSLYKPSIAGFWPLTTKCERRLVAFSSFLNEAGRLQLTNSILTALPMFAMSSYLLPKTIVEQIDKFKRHCLWRGADTNSKKPPKAAWPKCCLPKEEGGLGILNINKQNESLLFKHLHKFFNKDTTPWVQLIWDKYYSGSKLLPSSDVPFRGSFWWRDILKSLNSYKNLATLTIRSGSTCLLWYDSWTDDPLKQQYPELFSFAINPKISLATASSYANLRSLFHLPLSPEAYLQYLNLKAIIQNLQLTNECDIWSYNNGHTTFSSHYAYLHLVGHHNPHPVFHWLWNSFSQNKRKIFFWLLLNDRLNTRSLLCRKNMHLPSYCCVLCHLNVEEDLTHLRAKMDMKSMLTTWLQAYV